MSLSSSLLIGFFVSLISALTTAFEFSVKTKYVLSSLGMTVTIIPLIINLYVFLISPFGRWRHIKNEFMKLILSDSYELLNIRWTVEGRSLYCNQSMVPKSVLNPRILYYLDEDINPNFELPKNYQKIEEFGEVKNAELIFKNFNEGEMPTLDGYQTLKIFRGFCCHVPNEIYGILNQGDSGHRNREIFFSKSIGEIKIEIKHSNIGDKYANVISITHYSGYNEELNISDLNYEKILMLCYISTYHSKYPEVGVTSKNFKYRRGVEELHCFSYQELIDLIKHKSLRIMQRYSRHFVVEGFDEGVESLSLFLPKDFDERFGEENRVSFAKHHVEFWGKFNFKALDFVMKRRNCHDYRKIGPNWKSKRYLVDISYMLERIGKCRFGNIDLSIKPTLIARKHFSMLKEYVGGEELHVNVLKYNPDEISKIKDENINKLKQRDNPERNTALQNVKICRRLLGETRKIKPVDRKSMLEEINSNWTEVKTHTNDYNKHPISNTTMPENIPVEDKGEVSKDRVKILKFYDDDIKLSEDSEYKPLLDNYKKSLTKEIDYKAYAEELRLSLFSWKRKSQNYYNFTNYTNGRKNFPINPLKYSNKVEIKNVLTRFDKNKRFFNKSNYKSNNLMVTPVSIKNTYEVLSNYEDETEIEQSNIKSNVVILPTFKRLKKEKVKEDEKSNIKLLRFSRKMEKKMKKRGIIVSKSKKRNCMDSERAPEIDFEPLAKKHKDKNIKLYVDMENHAKNISKKGLNSIKFASVMLSSIRNKILKDREDAKNFVPYEDTSELRKNNKFPVLVEKSDRMGDKGLEDEPMIKYLLGQREIIEYAKRLNYGPPDHLIIFYLPQEINMKIRCHADYEGPYENLKNITIYGLIELIDCIIEGRMSDDSDCEDY